MIKLTIIFNLEKSKINSKYYFKLFLKKIEIETI